MTDPAPIEPALASPAAEPATPSTPAAPYTYQPVPPVVGSPTLGRTAFVMAVVTVALSIAASVIIGILGAPYAVHTAASWNYFVSMTSSDPAEAALAWGSIVHVLLGTVFGIWALTQGIVAIATNRGRGFGIAALVIAFLGPGLTFITFAVTQNLAPNIGSAR